MAAPLATAAWTDPTNAVPSFAQLMGNLLWLYGKVNDFQGANPKVSPFVPSYRITDDGQGVVLQLNGADAAPALKLPAFGRRAGEYTVGAHYEEGAVVSNPLDGSSYYAAKDFVASESAQHDIDVGNLRLEVRGIVYPLDSAKVKDAAQDKTLDLVIASFAASIAANAAVAATNAANIAAINEALGDAEVAGFPLTLQEPPTGSGGGSGNGNGSGGSGGNNGGGYDPGNYGYTPPTGNGGGYGQGGG